MPSPSTALVRSRGRFRRGAEQPSPSQDAELRTSVEMDPTNLWANRNLGACLAQERRLEQAKEYFLKALETLLKLAPFYCVIRLGGDRTHGCMGGCEVNIPRERKEELEDSDGKCDDGFHGPFSLRYGITGRTERDKRQQERQRSTGTR